MYFRIYLWNTKTYFNKTYHTYSLASPHDTGEIFKVMGSKVKVTDNSSGHGKPIDSSLVKTVYFGHVFEFFII